MTYKQRGLAVVLQRLFGDRGTEILGPCIGKKITSCYFGDDDALHLAFEDGECIRLFDDGQSCCERRYMRTDDDPHAFEGSILQNVEIRDAPDMTDDTGDTHEVQFLVVTTSAGSFTMASHNEHNGYYGGFAICCAIDEVKATQ